VRFKVFVYGTLKRGFRLHRFLAGARYLGEAKVSGFKMYDLGWYPGIVPGEGLVHGELYEVDLKTLLLLDEVEAEGEEYDRRLCEVITEDGRKTWAFVYVYRGKADPAREVKSGRWQKK